MRIRSALQVDDYIVYCGMRTTATHRDLRWWSGSRTVRATCSDVQTAMSTPAAAVAAAAVIDEMVNRRTVDHDRSCDAGGRLRACQLNLKGLRGTFDPSSHDCGLTDAAESGRVVLRLPLKPRCEAPGRSCVGGITTGDGTNILRRTPHTRTRSDEGTLRVYRGKSEQREQVSWWSRHRLEIGSRLCQLMTMAYHR